MSLSISQMLSASYPAVLAEKRKPTNQWAENAALTEFERMGMLVRRSFGPTLEIPLDYQANAGTDFLATDLTPTASSKTEVLTAASYTPAQLSVPIVWSKMDEATNPTENQKIALVKSLMENALNSHDDAIEEALFTTSTDGFLGMATFMPSTGQPNVGGIDGATETFWRSYAGTYQSDGSDIEAAMTEAYNTAAKGSGSALAPKGLVSGSDAHALFEGTQQANQRWGSGEELRAGFKVLYFKDARYIFSQYGSTKIYFYNPKSFQVLVSKEKFRDKGETQELENAQGYKVQIYSALQTVSNNISRLAMIDEA